ncbi:MAG: hypothetical protein AKCLJLPJ_02467 [Fimbriimonadales bacterium]|nr:hypothetical protein [Fimbriimonadales bacterium]
MLLIAVLGIAQAQVLLQPDITITKVDRGSAELWVATDASGHELWSRRWRPSYVGPTPAMDEQVFIVPTAPLNLECVTKRGKSLWSIQLNETGEPGFVLATDRQVLYGIGIGTPAPGRYAVVSRNISDGKLTWQKPRSTIGRPIAALPEGRFIAVSDFNAKKNTITARNERGEVEWTWKLTSLDAESLSRTDAARSTWSASTVSDSLILRTVSSPDNGAGTFINCLVLSRSREYVKYFWRSRSDEE